MELGDSIITIIVIFLVAILLFIFPLMSISERNDDTSKLVVKVAVDEFLADTSAAKMITDDNYDRLVQTLAGTGNTYEIEIEIKVLDENPSKKTVQVESDKIGENIYYTIYTSQVFEEMLKNGGIKNLKEGDIVTVKVRNTNTTIAQMFRELVYTVTKKSDAIEVTCSIMV